MKPIFVVDYDPNWAKQFEALRASLLGTVGQLAECIEHVGSTSVHGLAAKPVIDIDIVVSAGNEWLGVTGAVRTLQRHVRFQLSEHQQPNRRWMYTLLYDLHRTGRKT